MKTLNEIMEFLTGPAMLEELADLLREKDPRFPEAEQKYLEAAAYLRSDLPDAIAPKFESYLRACQTEVIANLVYAAYLGYRVNLEDFHSPCQTFFYKADFTEYIRDHLMGHFPMCYEASRIQDAFSKELPQKYDDAVSAVDEYFTFLDTSGPKLAHYAGYMIANKFLPWVEPGYHEDYIQTSHYQSRLRKYMGYLPLE